MKLRIPILACLFFLVLSCRTTPLEEVENLDPQLDGQSIFKTVFFNLGDVADEIPSFKESVDFLESTGKEHPEFMQNYIANVDNYIASIEKTNPGYFEQLKEAVYAQDFVAIKRVMKLGDLLILPTVIQSNLNRIEYEPLKRDIEALNIESIDFKNEDQLEKLSGSLLSILSKYDSEYENANINNGRCLFFAAAVAVTVAAVGNFVYAVNVAWSGNVNWTRNWSIPLRRAEFNYDAYAGEELIKEIAIGFNP
ncbi:hypothetical protein [Aureispira anguillae]|uniref:Antimicrobial peptide, SdpC family n=1 Tax=Aureispira anguillae TaxID=2864201 RepID=A0A916DXJ4_9BACT|nr:hypothetical protein [Aureispira anguillae]BDS15146.1 hypothetical protein AsAng_0059300 [Aureispira anguillae]